jgi:hypothetical protein
VRGDVLKTIGVDGSTITISGGFVKTTTKRATAVLYSLFASDWVGNMFVSGDAVLQSTFQELHTNATTLDNLLDIGRAAESSLEWLVRTGDATGIAAATRMIDGGIYVTDIEITEVDETVTSLSVIKYPSYWEVRGLEA